MGRIGSGLVALGVGAAVLVLGPGAQAQTVLSDVQVTPTEVTAQGTNITVTGEGFPGAVGCSSGQIRALPTPETSVDKSIPFATGDFDAPWSSTQKASDLPLATGEYSIVLVCNDGRGNAENFSTNAKFTVTNAATTTTTIPTTTTTTLDTTTTVPAGTAGTVEPSSVKPGFDTLTIRGGGFKPGAQLTITLNSTPVTAIGTTNATATGAYAATLKLPASAPPGAQQLVVSGPGPDDAPRSTTASLTVQDLSCSDFATSTAAQAALGAGGADPHGLDADRDGVACETVSARSATSAGGTAAAASGALPATGSRHAPLGVIAGLTAMTLGALLVGLSHPATPAAGHHRGRRGRRS